MTLLNVNQHQILFVKVNDAATAAPTVTDDADAGYSLGSRWIDITNDEIYFCVDATAGAAVWRRAVGSTDGWVVHTVDAAVVASVTQTQAGGTSVTEEIVEVITVANTDDAVTLPTASAGRECKVINSGINRLQVFPAVSDQIDSKGSNNSFTIAPDTSVTFSAIDTLQWYT